MSTKENDMQIDEATMVDLKNKACAILGLPTLETQCSDGLDFHDIAVWTIVDLLKMAYAAGHQQGQLDSN
jgi:hypothetical protein